MTDGLLCGHCVTLISALLHRSATDLASSVHAAVGSIPLERSKTTVNLNLLRLGFPSFESSDSPGAIN